MASKNAARFIGDALDSIELALGGLDGGYEIVFADNESKDGSADIAARHPSVRIASRRDNGVYDGMNRAIASATGRYLLILNSDDVLLPDGLAAAIAALEANPDAKHALGGVRIGSDPRAAPLLSPVRKLSPEGILFGIPAINARVFRREALAAAGGFNMSLGLGADRDWLLRLASAFGPGLAVEAPLYGYRQHATSLTVGGGRESRLRCYSADLALAEHLIATYRRRSTVGRLAAASRALQLAKLRLNGQAAGFPLPGPADLARGVAASARWRGRLSGV